MLILCVLSKESHRVISLYNIGVIVRNLGGYLGFVLWLTLLMVATQFPIAIETMLIAGRERGFLSCAL